MGTKLFCRLSFIIALVLLAAPRYSFSQVKSSYFLYEDKKLKIDDRSFRRYVLPQLKALNQEFFLILKKLHPAHETTIKIYLHLKDLERDYAAFSKECTTLGKECYQSLDSLYRHSRKLENLLFFPQRDVLNFSNEINKSHTDSILQLLSDLSLLNTHNYQLMHKLEEYLITANTSYSKYFDGKKNIEPRIHEMVIAADLMLIPLLQPALKAPFHTVWIHFFSKLSEYLLYRKDQKFLIARLEELNLAWNTFHMKMTKENKDLPPKLIKLIKIMHNRWNSCLKIILR